MATSYHGIGSTHSEPAKSEQIITELFTKILQIILESRRPQVYSRNFNREQAAVISSPASSSSSSSCSTIRSRDKWFNLAIRDCSAVLENIEFWRQTNFDPMVIDVILMRGSNEKIIERWVLQYNSSKEDCSSSTSKRCSSSSGGKSLNALYRKSILLLRSLYSSVRLLPAYRLFRDLNSSCQISHRVSTFVEPFTRNEESERQQFLFTPLETISGRISLSLLYIPSISEANSDKLMSRLPVAPQLISHYIGSPLSNPLNKKFPSLVCSPHPPPRPFSSKHGLPPLSSSNCSRSDRKSRLVQSSSSTTDDKQQQCTYGQSSSTSGRYSVVKTSVLSRLLATFEENFDDSKFSGAFLDDEDLTNDPVFNRRKKDAAVGALVQMLNKAPPLGGCFLRKTTADALEELRSYSDFKHLLQTTGSGRGAAATIITPSPLESGLV
ncbi:autophagy-related protein 13b-like [Impatiens glandulifera]|uniref:autophagy-related protein 13b-like n=1 Tax=Impatiens glandulifera TaxID=253017 RepID=UPI001FB0F98F|nr:autophagy-related protein 13b-like [Impatiens glandulifera]